MSAVIRAASRDDADQIAAIYAPSVTQAVTSFELEPPGATEMARRLAATLEVYPWLVCDRGGEILGYVRAGRFHDRAAYQWAVEVSAYMRGDMRRTGLGRALYTSLFAVLVHQGFCTAYAGVSLPNPGSVGLHESMGFVPVGVYRAAGYKMGGWHDVGWWQRPLVPLPLPHDPPPPRPFPLVTCDPEYPACLAQGAPLLRV